MAPVLARREFGRMFEVPSSNSPGQHHEGGSRWPRHSLPGPEVEHRCREDLDLVLEGLALITLSGVTAMLPLEGGWAN